MDQVIRNTLETVLAAIGNPKTSLKVVAADCRVYETQVSDDWSKAAFARLSDCTTRKQFISVLSSLEIF